MEILLWVVVALLVVVWLGVVFIGPPYVPTLKRDLKYLFSHLKLHKDDLFVDLGAGDGRVLAMAAQSGARVAGVEINPFLVAISRLRVSHSKGKVAFGDMWQYRLPDGTTHVFVFAAGKFMNKLEDYLAAESARVGHLTVICYAFKFPNRLTKEVTGAFNLYEF